jgi:DNA polymerase-3 subunit delta'
MPLRDVFCQDKAVAFLQRAFQSGKVPHAYIFAGMEGVGKFKTARQWAKLLLCENPSRENGFADSCSLCESCRLFEADSHPDFHHVYKELLEFTKEGKGKKTPVRLPIDVIREFLIQKVATKPTLSHRKVSVVSEAEKLNAASQNALLKVLEEPPAYCCIVLLCTRLERLLPTTKSRCQIVRFGPIDKEKISARLREMHLQANQAQYFARLSQGSMGTACQWAALQSDGAELYQTKKKVVAAVASCELQNALELAHQFLDSAKNIAAVWSNLDADTSKADINRRAQKTLIQVAISALHDAMMLNTTANTPLINFDQENEVRKLANRLAPEEAAERIADCYRSLRWIEAAVNEKLLFEQLLLSFAKSDIITIE